jgi:hypothetical protein
MADNARRDPDPVEFDEDLDDTEEERSPEYAAAYAWLAEHGDELALFPGEWVAWADGQVLAHDRSLAVVQDAIDASDAEHPFLIPVPPAEAMLA